MSSQSLSDRTPVLILSSDAVTAALLSIFAELEGFRPVYSGEAERPEEAVQRLAPRIVLIDCDHQEACSDQVLDRAQRLGARVIVFSPGRMHDDVRAFAEERELPFFALPIDRASLAAILRSTSLALLPLALLLR